MKLLTAAASLIVFLSGSLVVVDAQADTQGAPHDSDLFKTIASLDRAVFDAYNTCDLEKFASFFVDDVEFYHDKGGLTPGRQRLVESVKNNICGKVRRELVPTTLEVYPMDGYGALQTGSHVFCEMASKRCEGIARYIHLWQRKDGAWKITRVMSYDHRANR